MNANGILPPIWMPSLLRNGWVTVMMTAMARAGNASDDGEKTYLNCPFDDKDECKALGGRWDGDAKKWYVPAGKDTVPFAKWL